MSNGHYSRAERRTDPGGPLSVRKGAPGRAPLSTAHIGPPPEAEYWTGARLLTISKGGKCDAVGGGKRGKVAGFTLQSRKRLMRMIAKVRQDAALPLFGTLTYPDAFPEPHVSKVHLKALGQRIKRRYPDAGVVWKLEPQERGAPHFHMLMWGVPLMDVMEWLPRAWYEIAGGGDIKHLLWHQGLLGNGNRHCVEPVRSYRGVTAYASKYLGKTFEVAGWKWPGRYWGVLNPQGIPFGIKTNAPITLHEAVNLQRYQRRYAHIKAKGRQRKLTTFCDAEGWLDGCLGQGGFSPDAERLRHPRSLVEGE